MDDIIGILFVAFFILMIIGTIATMITYTWRKLVETHRKAKDESNMSRELTKIRKDYYQQYRVIKVKHRQELLELKNSRSDREFEVRKKYK
jgi:hypothetical protein